MKMNVESFNLDHTKVKAPYIRVADKKTGANGDLIVKYDVRLKQPNQAIWICGATFVRAFNGRANS